MEGKDSVTVPVISNGEHARFRHNVPQVCPVEPVRELKRNNRVQTIKIIRMRATTMAIYPSRQKKKKKANLDDRLVVDLAMLVHGRGVDLEDLKPRLLVRERHLDFAVEATGAHQCRIERIRPIGRHDKLCAPERVEAVHLVQQLCVCVHALVSQPIIPSRAVVVEVDVLGMMAGQTSINVRWISRSALVPSENRRPPMASISSMKMTQGSWSRA